MKITTYISILVAAGITTVQAQVLTPVPVQQGDINTLVSGMPQLVLLTNGATVMDDTEIAGYEGFHVIDGLINQTAYPWANEPINGTTNNPWIPPDHFSPPAPPVTDYVILDFTGTNSTTVSNTVGMIIIEGRFAGRGAGTYTLQYTTDQPPIVIGSTWTTLGTYTWASPLPLPQLAFQFAAIHNVTGFQLLSDPDPYNNGTNAATGSFWCNSIQQIQIYSPFTNVPSIVAQPQGTNVFVAGTVQLRVAAAGGTSYQWFKNGSPISGATSNTITIPNAQVSDSGTYKVVVSNLIGPVTSSDAVVNVSIPAPRVITEQSAYQFAWTNVPNFTYAVQGSPDGITYTTITNWTVNVGNLVETVVPRPTPYSHFQLTLIAHP
jgi:hypothetical protein